MPRFNFKGFAGRARSFGGRAKSRLRDTAGRFSSTGKSAFGAAKKFGGTKAGRRTAAGVAGAGVAGAVAGEIYGKQRKKESNKKALGRGLKTGAAAAGLAGAGAAAYLNRGRIKAGAGIAKKYASSKASSVKKRAGKLYRRGLRKTGRIMV